MHQLFPPDNEKIFEELLRDLFNENDNSKNYQLYGRKGQNQKGIDVYSVVSGIAIQAKKKDIVYRSADALRKELKEDIINSIKAARKFKGQISILIIASTFKDDAEIQNFCYEESLKTNTKIEYWGWDHLKNEISKHKSLLRQYYNAFIIPIENERQINIDKIRSTRKTYPEVVDYIPRSIQQISQANSYPPSRRKEYKRRKFLPDIIKENKRILLLASGGIGKSIELENLSFFLSKNNTSYYVIKVSLKNYINSLKEQIELEELNWENIPENQLVILLDGLDEVNDHDIERAINDINNFSKKYFQCKIVISCRTNIYNIESNRLENYNIYYPEDLSELDIKKYLFKRLSFKADEFIELAKSNKIYDLLCIPFNLKNIVNFYIDGKKLPKKRFEVYKLLYEQILIKDINKFDGKGIRISNKKMLINYELKKLALSIEALERNWITSDELQILIQDSNILHLILHSSILNKSYNQKSFSFESNVFQEFLAASLLVEQDFETIKFYMFNEKTNKLKPSWANTFSFLMDMCSENNEFMQIIFDFLRTNDLESITRIETDKISVEIKEELFLNIVENDWKKGMSLYNGNISFRALSIFSGQSETILKYLLKNLSESQNDSVVRDAIRLISYFKELHSLKGKVKAILLKIATNKNEKAPTRMDAIEALGSLQFDDNRTNDIICKLPFDGFGNIGNGVFNYIIKTHSIEKNINTLIRGLIASNQSILSPGGIKTEAYNTSYEFSLTECIKNIESKECFIKLISFLIKEPNKVDLRFNDSFLAFITTRLTNLYNEDKSILKLVVKLYDALDLASMYDSVQTITTFFDETGTRLSVFKKKYKQMEKVKSYYGSDGLLADKQCVDYVVSLHKIEKSSHESLRRFLSRLMIVNRGNEGQDIYNYANERIIELFGNIYDDHISNFSERKLQLIKRDILYLFDIKLLLNDAKNFFIKENIESISYVDLREIIERNRTNRESDTTLFYYSLLYHVLSSLTKRNNIATYEIIYARFSDEDYLQRFRISRLVHYIKENTINVLNETQTIWINTWSFEKIKETNFLHTYRLDAYGNHKVNLTDLYLGFFYQKFNFALPEDKILKMFRMISVSGYELNQNLSNIILARIDNNKVKKAVAQNMKYKRVKGGILEKHIELCISLEIQDSLPYLLNEFRNENNDIHLRTTALKAYIKLEGSVKKLIPDVINFNLTNNSIYWIHILSDYIIEKQEGKALEKRFLKLANENSVDDEYYNYIFTILLKVGNIKGFEMQIEWVKRGVDAYYRSIEISGAHYLDLPFEPACDCLMKFIQVFDEEFNDPTSWILNSIQNIFLILMNGSVDRFDSIKDKLLNKIESSDSNKYSLLYYWIKRMEYRLDHYEKNSKTVSMVNDMNRRLNIPSLS